MDPALLITWKGLLASWDGWLLTFALAVIVPTLGHVRFRQMRARGNQVVAARTKLRLYGTTIGWQWFLVALMLLVVRRHGLSVGDVGERFGDARVTIAVTLALLAILAVVSAIVFWRLRRAPPQTLAASGGRLRHFIPAFGLEMIVFVGLCVTAGICEELLYRGWLVNILWAATGSPWVAVVVGAIMFGIGHAYQGAWGMLRTSFVGLQLAALFVIVGSLVPGQVLHAGVDLLVGVAGAVAVTRSAADDHSK